MIVPVHFAFIFFFIQIHSQLCLAEPAPYYGTLIGKLSNKEEGISGRIYAVDKNTVFIRNFTYTGDNSPLFLYAGTLGNDGGYTKTGYPLKNVKGAVQMLKESADGKDITLIFPKGKSLYEVDWLGFISRKKKALYSRVIVNDDVKEKIPRSQTLPQTLRGKNGLSASSLVIVDSRTIMIKDFTFMGLAPDTFFFIGTQGGRPVDAESQGFPIPDERGSDKPLSSYLNKTLVLSIPPGRPDIFSARWFSIYSIGLKRSLAHVSIPVEPNVPPSLDKLGIDPQATLNCEVLYQDMGFELRWTMPSKDKNCQDEPDISDPNCFIILQLVSKTANDRYLAFGVRSDDEQHKVAGDVTVGWINARTGKGSVDDYFLAHSSNTKYGKTLKCSDGAESCPDESKPGGSKQVELLNAVSRDNYTMITYKRPLKASDIYDVSISTLPKFEQNVFWSIGYKSSEMRKIHKPKKNDEPIPIIFGRRPKWNCPVDGEDFEKEIDDDEVSEIDFRISESKTIGTNESPERRRPLKSNPPPNRQIQPSKPIKERNPLRRKVPRTRPGANSPANNWSDIFSPPTKPQPEVGGFRPELKDSYQITNPQLNQNNEPLRDLELLTSAPTRKTSYYSLPDPLANAKERVASNFPMRKQNTSRNKSNAVKKTEKAKFAIDTMSNSPWDVPSISCKESKTKKKPIYIHLGPSALHRGNQGIGKKDGGTALYANGLLTPDIYLERGSRYTFLIETGAGDIGNYQDFHPIYITSDSSGGHQLKPDLEAKVEEMYAGVERDRDGLPVPAAFGRLCRWWGERPAATFASYTDFQKSLHLDCQDFENEGSEDRKSFTPKSLMSSINSGGRNPKRKRRPPGILQFTPTKEMPDTVYYQSFTAKHLGGVIHLVDKCEDIETRNKYPFKSSNDVAPTFRPQLRVHLMATKLANDTRENSFKQVRRKKPFAGYEMTDEKTSFGESLILSNKNPNRNQMKSKRKKIKLQERIGNGGTSSKNSIRRMDTDVANTDYVDEDETIKGELDFFDARTRKKWNLCKRRASQKERKIDDNPSDLGLPMFEHFPILQLNKNEGSDEKYQRHFDLECQQLVQKFVAEKSSNVNRNIKKPGKKKASMPLLTPKFDKRPILGSITRKKEKTILNDQLRKQIQLQDLHSNSPTDLTSEYTAQEEPIGTRRKFGSDLSSELTFDRLFNSDSHEKHSKNRRKPNFAEAKDHRKNLSQQKHSQRPQSHDIERNTKRNSQKATSKNDFSNAQLDTKIVPKGFGAFLDSKPKRRLPNGGANIKENENGSLDKTLSSFGLSNVDPQFLNPSLLHNGFMFDQEESIKQHSKHPNSKKQSLNQYDPLDLPQVHGLKRKQMNSQNEYEFLTVRPTKRTTRAPSIHISDEMSPGSSPPTLPPPSGDIPPFMLHQIQYTSKMKNMDKKLSAIVSNTGNSKNRPSLKKPLSKPRPPFSPQPQQHISSFDKPLRSKQGIVENQGNNPILRLFKNVQKKSSSLTNIFSPKSWFKESNQGIVNRNLGQNRLTQKNSQNFNRRMSPARMPNRQRKGNKRPPIKMVEGNFHHPTNYKYERPFMQKSRDEKSTPDEVLKDNQFFTRKLDKSKQNGNIKNNVLKIPPMDMDASGSIQSTVVHNGVNGADSKSNILSSPDMFVNGAKADQSQQMQLNDMLEAEKLAAIIEALADQKVMSDSMKINQVPTLNQDMGTNLAITNRTKPSRTMNQALGTRPTDKALLGLPGQSISPLMNKRKSSYGQGFDPSGIQPESGFKPIVVGEVQSMPSLAFSVLDSMPDEYLDQQSSNSNSRDMSVIMQQQSGDSNQFQNSQPLISSQQFTNRRISINNPQLFGENVSNQKNVEGGDRGHIAVNVPSPVVPYVPNQALEKSDIFSDGSLWQKLQQTSGLAKNPQRPDNPVLSAQSNIQGLASTYDFSHSKVDQSNSISSSLNPQQPSSHHSNVHNKKTVAKISDVTSAADFSSFKDTNQPPVLQVQGNDFSKDEEFHETDRIDVPSLIDPNALIYSSNSAPYGEQFPSYIPDSIATVVGSTLNTDKQLSSGNNIVYGRGKVVDSKKDNDETRDLKKNTKISSKLSNLKNVFMKPTSYEDMTDEDEYYDEDYNDYDDMLYSDNFEHSGDDYIDDLYEDDKYLQSLNRKLKLVDQILKESKSENLSQTEKDDGRLTDLVNLWEKH